MTTRPGFPSFKGAFKTFSVSVSTNREYGTDSRLLVYSQGSRAKVLKYLWLKHLWDELSQKEFELFITCPETLNNPLQYGALRASFIIGKVKVREQLIDCPFLEESDKPLRVYYQGFKRLDVEISRFTRSLPKVPKFKGWIRSSSAKDSKRRQGGSRDLSPLAIMDYDYEELYFDWYNYLTVDGFLLIPSK
jgi:hypothetical protein